MEREERLKTKINKIHSYCGDVKKKCLVEEFQKIRKQIGILLYALVILLKTRKSKN